VKRQADRGLDATPGIVWATMSNLLTHAQERLLVDQAAVEPKCSGDSAHQALTVKTFPLCSVWG
jgi:hypothetical protein